MKVNDTFKQAEVTLSESVNLLQKLEEMKKALRCFQEWRRDIELESNGTVSITFPIYMRESVKALMNATVKNFGIVYPNIQTHFLNGDGESAAINRLSSSIMTVSAMIDKLQSMNYLIRSDEERNMLKTMNFNSIQHLLLFIDLQYKLDKYPMEEYLPLFTYCEKEDILVEEFIHKINILKTEYRAFPYIYEVPSETADEFCSVVPELYQRAEEIRFPITEDVAREALLSEESMQRLSDSIEKASRENIVTDTRTSHEEILQKLQLGASYAR